MDVHPFLAFFWLKATSIGPHDPKLSPHVNGRPVSMQSKTRLMSPFVPEVDHVFRRNQGVKTATTWTYQRVPHGA